MGNLIDTIAKLPRTVIMKITVGMLPYQSIESHLMI